MSATPTLELGIDVGDLSTVVLCSVPPAQANYLQRIGRAGRRDGNAFTATVATGQPHDLYFYAEPLAMLAGRVEPPGVFLNAPAVLERQLTAFCLDGWAATGLPEDAVPRTIRHLLDNVEQARLTGFPYPFLDFVQRRGDDLLEGFFDALAGELTAQSRDYLTAFLHGDEEALPSLRSRMVNRFLEIAKERKALRADVEALGRRIQILKRAPADEATNNDIEQLRLERRGLQAVLRRLNGRETFNFLTDEGLLPNYAFPEAGVTLKSVIYRSRVREEEAGGEPEGDREVYEYVRPAASALSEFAPDNDFYAGGNRVSIDRIDLRASPIETWRLCRSCDHCARVDVKDDHVACPRCGDVMWSDAGQRREMLPLRMVHAATLDRRASILDERDDREPLFFTRQLAADFEPGAVKRAYALAGSDAALWLRVHRVGDLPRDELRAPRRGRAADGVRRAGPAARWLPRVPALWHGAEERQRRCAAHVDLQRPQGGAGGHRRLSVPLPRVPIRGGADAAAGARRARVRATRQLVRRRLGARSPTPFQRAHRPPACDDAPQLLSAASANGSSAPGEASMDDTGAAHQYLLLYDTVPSGTGYLKELMTEPEKLLSVFENAREALKSCVCNQDPLKDGCYRCVFAYRRSREMAETSRDTAIKMLDRILARKDELEEVPSLGGLKVTATLESELEARFVEALRRVEVDGRQAVQMRADLVRGKPGYVLKVGSHSYYMETQAELGASDGVVEPCRPDFLIRPARPESGQRPVAVFTDGFEFHRDTTDADSLKRMALIRAGFLVWSLTWHDLEFVFGKAPDVPDLLAGTRESGSMAALQRKLDARWGTASLRAGLAEPTLMLLVNCLRAPEPSRWKQAVFTELFGLFDHGRMLSDALRADFDRAAAALPGQVHEALSDLPPPVAIAGLGAWGATPSTFFDLLMALPLAAVQQGDPDAAAIAVHLHDDEASRESANYRRTWNGVLRLFTLLQFLPGAWWTTRVGVERDVYPEFAPVADDATVPEPASGTPSDDWRAAIELTSPELHALLKDLSTRDAPVPEVGFELPGSTGAVLARAELGWPGNEVAVLLADQGAHARAFEQAGWRVFASDVNDLAEAVANALAEDV